MTVKIVNRGNTAFFTFTFYDENGDVAVCQSAELQLTYMGRTDYVTEKVTLSSSDNNWLGQWVSANAKAGWVQYHAHAYSSGTEFAEDGRFRVTGNRASLDHDPLPYGATRSKAEDDTGSGNDAGLGADYGFRW
jgi:hypothetical protein